MASIQSCPAPGATSLDLSIQPITTIDRPAHASTQPGGGRQSINPHPSKASQLPGREGRRRRSSPASQKRRRRRRVVLLHATPVSAFYGRNSSLSHGFHGPTGWLSYLLDRAKRAAVVMVTCLDGGAAVRLIDSMVVPSSGPCDDGLRRHRPTRTEQQAVCT